MRKGILEYCILALLSRRDSYAPRIIATLKEAEMIVVEGTLYPILTRQKNAGLLTYRWEESPQGPPRKVYSLTDKGRQYLEALDEAWDELVAQIHHIRHELTDGQQFKGKSSEGDGTPIEVVRRPDQAADQPSGEQVRLAEV